MVNDDKADKENFENKSSSHTETTHVFDVITAASDKLEKLLNESVVKEEEIIDEVVERTHSGCGRAVGQEKTILQTEKENDEKIGLDQIGNMNEGLETKVNDTFEADAEEKKKISNNVLSAEKEQIPVDKIKTSRKSPKKSLKYSTVDKKEEKKIS